MSAIALLPLSLTLSLVLPTGTTSRTGSVILRDTLERGGLSLNDMFREVEELMEDTQHLLEEAVDQINTESTKTSSLDIRSNSLNDTKKIRNDESRFRDQETDNRSAEMERTSTHMEAPSLWNSLDHECMVDEDCGDPRYCLFEIGSSRCLPCIPADMPCTKDEECCSDRMCVWGQCTVNAAAGSEGTICQGQSDCRQDLCCAFQREFLFPVCNPNPAQGESCWSHPNLLMDMLAWDQEGPRDHCPCGDGLQCRPHGRRSICEE